MSENQDLNLPDTQPDSSEQDRHSITDGVEKKNLFKDDEESRIIQKIDDWFEKVKEAFPTIGLIVEADRLRSNGSSLESLKELSDSFDLPEGIVLPPELFELFDAILHNSVHDPLLGKQKVKFLLERTGNTGTHIEDQGYHLDTKQIYWDEHGRRIAYDPKRSLDKYMVYVGRPGTLIAHGKIDPELTQQQSNALGKDISGQVISQLLPNSIYKVAVGDLLHSPPPIQTGC